MKTEDVARRLGVSMRQMNYWLRRMGSVPGRGRPRDLPPEVVGDLASIFRARERCQSEIEDVLASYSEEGTE